MKYFNWMIIYATFLHLGWAIPAMLWGDTTQATPLARLNIWVAPHLWADGAIYLIVALLAIVALPLHDRHPEYSFLLLIPQQAIMFISASGSLEAIVLSQYADGVPRPSEFIFVDQWPNVLAAFLHLGALFNGVVQDLWMQVLSLLSLLWLKVSSLLRGIISSVADQKR